MYEEIHEWLARTLSLPLAVGFSGSSNWYRTALYLPDLMSSERLIEKREFNLAITISRMRRVTEFWFFAALFDKMTLMIYSYIMNRVSTADLRNNFRRVSSWLDNGETVEIVKRGKPYARLVPILEQDATITRPVDFAAQRKEIWKGRKFSAAEVAEMRGAEQEGED